jgi:hypothetical protein
MTPFSVPYHHGEPVDPSLLEWITEWLHDLTSLSPGAIVAIIGAAMVAVPLLLIAAAIRSRRSAEADVRRKG